VILEGIAKGDYCPEGECPRIRFIALSLNSEFKYDQVGHMHARIVYFCNFIKSFLTQLHRRRKRGDTGACPAIICLGDTIVDVPPIFCHRTNNLFMLSVIIKANLAYVPFLLCHYLPTNIK